MNTSVITSPSPIQSTSYKNANSICLANLHTWKQLASLASFSPPGLATLDALVDSTIHYEMYSYIKKLQHILPNIPDNGIIDSWLPLAQDREQWKTLGTEWIKHRQALTIYQYGPHPLLGDGILDHQFFWYLQSFYVLFMILLLF
jgi:hypothetical protein